MTDKYAVMIPFDGEMLYVTEGDTKFHFQAKLFDTQEKALEHANLWGDHAKVVEYTNESSRL